MTSPYRVCFVCSGNICRSPMAEVVLTALLAQEGLTDQVVVDSAGTGDWHQGDGADDRTVTALAGLGYDGAPHRARQFEPSWFATRDLVVAMDRGHLRTLRAWAPNDVYRSRVHLFSDLAGEAATGPDVVDPYNGDAALFDEVLAGIVAGCQGVVDHVRRDMAASD